MPRRRAISSNGGGNNAVKVYSTVSLLSYRLRFRRHFRPIEDQARPALLPVLVGSPEVTFMQNHYRICPQLRLGIIKMLPLLSDTILSWFQRMNTVLYPLIRLYQRHTHLFLFLEMQSESVIAAIMTRMSINPPGLAVQKAIVPVFTSMPISSCSVTEVNELRPVRFTAFFVDKTAPSSLRQLGQNFRSSGRNGARLRKMYQNVSRGLSRLRNASICFRSKRPYSTPPNPTSGRPGPFTVQRCQVLRWTNN
jgi:hypothetical protein